MILNMSMLLQLASRSDFKSMHAIPTLGLRVFHIPLPPLEYLAPSLLNQPLTIQPITDDKFPKRQVPAITESTTMAFVNPTSTFLGQPTRSSHNKCGLRRASTSHPTCPRMSFSSIDMPETAASLFDLTNDSKEAILTAAYKQVFGNAYIMDSERAELAKFESQFKMGESDVRDIVRAMGKSEAYRKRFFSRSGPYRFVELNYKHFLGRGPNNQEEVSFHVKKLINEGYDAEIDSYIDSDEYEENFGADTVPRFIFLGTYWRNDNFSRMCNMRKFWDGCSTSTVSGSTAPGKAIPSQLTAGYGGYCNGFTNIMKGLPAGFRPEPDGPAKLPPLPANSRAPLRVRIKVAENSYQVFEVPALESPDVEPAWKKELATKKTWNGVWF